MLKSLDYSVDFPTTGRSFQNRIEFAPGLTAVVGRNEAGKSLVLEMIDYALWGSAALRGTAADYVNLSVQLVFELPGREIVISRAKKQSMTINGEVVAVGAQAINAEVPRQLGFGMDVYFIAQRAAQGEIEALSKMRPTERKQMVDRLIGMDRYEGEEKVCKQEAKTAQTVAESLIASVTTPQEPVAPDDYRPSIDLEQDIESAEHIQRERERLLAIKKPEPPVEPEAPAETDVDALEAYESARQIALQNLARINGTLSAIPETRFSREELERALTYQQYQREVSRRGERPIMERHQVEDALATYARIEALREIGDTEVECPNCATSFRPGHAEIQEPSQNKGTLLDQLRRLDAWAEPLDEVEPFEIPNLQQEILAHARADERDQLVRELANIETPADRSGDLRAARAYQSALAVYEERLGGYDRALDDWRHAQERLATLADASDELADLRRRLGESRHYELALGRYREDLARYEAVIEQVGAHRAEAEGSLRAAAALRDTRIAVKQELAPSLSQAASALLASMTNGERRSIVVDEDFDIIVDGQPINTLSGSAKSVTNLALRLGLGQVLTAKVLPIFLGDEIDAAMDQSRAGSTHQTMQNLRNYLTQIILVTHKDVEADEIISL